MEEHAEALERGAEALLACVVASVSAVPVSVLNFPITRVVHIRQAQGALPGFQYSNVISTLASMPSEQGSVAAVWRGVLPALGVRVIGPPLLMVVNGQLRFSLRPGPRVSSTERMYRNVAIAGLSGGLVSVVTHPLAMASLRLQLDVGGGTLGERTFTVGRRGAASVITSIANHTGVLSMPFSLEGGLYRGVWGAALAQLVKRGAQFGVYATVRSDSLGASGNFALAMFATSCSDWVAYPIQVGVVRAQAAVAPIASRNGLRNGAAQYKGALDAMVSVARAEGLAALWRGFGLRFASSLGGAVLLTVWHESGVFQ